MALGALTLLGAGCSPSEEVFGNASSAGGGSGTGDATSAGDGGAPSTGSGGSGQGGDAASTSTSGPGGGGSACDDAADCEDPEGECAIAACVEGVCGEAFVPQGTPTIAQDVGDCRVTVCDGAGSTESLPDDTDVVDDENVCSIERCEGGALVVEDAEAGTPCGSGNLSCNGEGACVGCNAPAQCPGQDGTCRTRTCDEGVCGFDHEADGTPVDDPDGNCRAAQCDGAGNVETIVDAGDVPFDGNECTRDVCNDGQPANPPRTEGDPCSGGVCDGDGACVGCVEDADCGDDTNCAVYACDDGACDVLYADPGDFAADPVPDDCLHDECGAQGAIVEDVPDEEGTSCGGGDVCDGAGTCSECSSGDDCNTDVCGCGACVIGDLFFSQYIEGSLANKALEIYNPFDFAVDLELEDCAILRYRNGGNEPDAITLVGVVPARSAFAVCNAAASFAGSCDQTYVSAQDFNGNDAIVLACDDEYLDVIGEVGDDPGSQWGTGLTSTADNTLYRDPGIFVGDVQGFDAFDPADEWTGAPSDTFTGLGEHDPCDG